LLIQNIGSDNVYIKFGSAPTAGSDGMFLAAGGKGTLYMDVMVESQAVYAICASTETSTLMIVEGS
jgi:hypothetical protein